MRKLFKLFALLLMTSSSAYASHISGGEIIWECLGNGDYEFTIILYRDCDGITMPTTANLDFVSSCGTANLVADLVNQTEVSQLCPSQIINSTCNGGLLPGMEAYTYTGLINLAPCADWNVSWNTCCRNAAITNLANPGGLDSYIEANFDNLNYPCDNSAQFTAQPIPYVCLNQAVNYSFGAFDPDADSLSYSLVTAMEQNATLITYNAGFTPQQPIAGASINPFTGLLSFTPTMQGNYVFVVLVEQYDSQGNLIGTVMRDIQFIVIVCTNVQPFANDGDMVNFTGSALQTDTMSIQMCATDNFCFDFTISDPDAIDTLTLISNISQVLPGATFTYSGINPVMGQICWQGVPGNEGLNSFVINANDGSCPIPGLQTYVYDVLVLPRTSAGPDQIICGPQVAQLSAQGGSVFNWTVLSGDPINVGQNFSCNPCDNPIATPANSTTYVVTSNLGGGCLNADTVVVSVVPDFSFAAVQSDTVVCLGEPVNFDVGVTPNVPGYVYNWVPTVGLSDGSIANPVGIWGAPGTYTYVVEISSPDSCIKLDTSLTVTVLPAYAPLFSVNYEDSICVNTTTNPQVVLDNVIPTGCGINFGGCFGQSLASTDIGTDTLTNTNTSYPAPYGNWFNGARHQILYRASELTAMGMTAGVISELGFNIDVVNGLTDYQNFEIRMACTTQDELTQWVTGAQVVFPAQLVNIVPGWNMHTFQYGFNWDGFSNVLVEVCFDQDGITTFTNNSQTFWTNTGYNSVLFFRSDQGGVCYGGNPTQSMDRPNTRFISCVIDQSGIQYSWDPAAAVNPANSANPSITPASSPSSYTVTVGDPLTGCSSDETITINWYDPTLVNFTPSPDVGVAPFDANFINNSSSNVINFNWDFGDINGSTSNQFEPGFTYGTPGWYIVTLTGTDANGCLGTYTDSVEVLPDPIAVFPNVFSPNGDGLNDNFQFIEFKGFRAYEIKIFSRWGNIVHQTTKVNSSNRIWSPGTEHSEGTYFYTFVGEGVDGTTKEIAGHVTLLRQKKQ